MRDGIKIANDVIIEMASSLDKNQLQELSNSLNNNLQNVFTPNKIKECNTLEESFKVIDQFIAFKRACNLSENTLTTYRINIRAFFDHMNVPLMQVTEETIKSYLSYKIQSISAISVNNIRMCLSSFFSWCYDSEYILKNPCVKNLVPIIKVPETIKPDLTAADMVRIKDACLVIEDPLLQLRAKALIDFLESTGCRVSEVCALQVDDLDLTKKQAKIHGKGDKERLVYLTPACVQHLKEYFKYREAHGKPSPYVFSNIRRDKLLKPMNTHLVEKITKDLGTMCELDMDLTVHKFRRYFATAQFLKGVTPDTIRMLMGHSNYQTTLSYINQNSQRAVNEIAKIYY